MSNFLGQLLVEKYGHVASLEGSFFISFSPILLFGLLMPETLGHRGSQKVVDKEKKADDYVYVEMK